MLLIYQNSISRERFQHLLIDCVVPESKCPNHPHGRSLEIPRGREVSNKLFSVPYFPVRLPS